MSHEEELLEELAIASLKMGELDNCISPDGRLICALPLDSSVAHEDKRGASGRGWLLDAVDGVGAGGHPRVTARDLVAEWWLIWRLGHIRKVFKVNIEFRRSRLNRQFDTGKFKEIAPYAGLYAVNTAGGSIIEDFDNDGLLDVVTSTWDPCKPITFYRNEGDGTFEDVLLRKPG